MEADMDISNVKEVLINLDHHLDTMMMTIERYSATLLGRNVQSIEAITDEYHRSSMNYGTLQLELQKAIAQSIEILAFEGEGSNRKIQLSFLIECLREKGYMEAANELSQFRTQLTEKAEEMDKKHAKMIHLLLFASSCNSQWLRDLYSLADMDYKHYTPAGMESKQIVGVGLNEEI
jgi:hypothetical protein